MPPRPQISVPELPARLKVALPERAWRPWGYSSAVAFEPSDPGPTAESLKVKVKLDRHRARVARRRRLTRNMALGAVAMYHLDPDHGRERRRANAGRIRRLLGWLGARWG